MAFVCGWLVTGVLLQMIMEALMVMMMVIVQRESESDAVAFQSSEATKMN